MSAISRDGVCYDLRNSPYKYVFCGYVFCFSTPYHKRSFADKLAVKIDWLKDSMQRRFRFYQDVTMQAAFHWYRQVETRGFCVFSPEGECFTCPENIEFLGTRISYRS